MTGSEVLAPVPPCARGSSRRRIEPVLAVAVVLLAALLMAWHGTPAAASPPGRSTSGPAPGGAQAATMTLASQNPWVSGSSGSTINLRVATALPDSRLSLDVVLYSRLGSRDAFVETLGGTEPASEYPLDSPAPVPVSDLRHGEVLHLHLPVTTTPDSASSPSSPTLDLHCGTGSCAGVYPLELVLLDQARDAPLTSLTTYLVYAPSGTGALPLEVSLVLPIGAKPALSPAGAPLLDRRQVIDLTGLSRVLQGARTAPVSLALHGQLLEALARSHNPRAPRLLSRLSSLASSPASGGTGDELLRAPFASASVDQLAASGLTGQLQTQLAADTAAVASTLHLPSPATAYVARHGLDAGGLHLLTTQGIHTVVVPPSALATPATPVSTPTSPLLLSHPGAPAPGSAPPAGTVPAGTTEVAESDPGLAARFDAPTADPVLAAHQFLAELASVYFDDPYSTQPRGVVVTPRLDGSSNRFVALVLAGLAGSPVLQAETISGLVSSVPVGANGDPGTGTLAADRPGTGPSASSVRAAERRLRTVRSVVPTDQAMAERLRQSILLGESSALSRRRRARYEAAPARALRGVGRDLSLSSSSTTTLTSRSGRIPVTVESTLPYPVHVVLRLHSSELTFAANRSVYQVPLDLTGKAIQSDIRVSTRTSGLSRLNVALLSPHGGHVIVGESIAVRSTAISGVAVALSAGALLVLIAWWVRSSLRRRAARARRESTGTPAATPLP